MKLRAILERAQMQTSAPYAALKALAGRFQYVEPNLGMMHGGHVRMLVAWWKERKQ